MTTSHVLRFRSTQSLSLGADEDVPRADRQRNSPLTFPTASPNTVTNWLHVAMTGRMLHDFVLKRAWHHVVITSQSQVRALLTTPVNGENERYYQTTIRCDIMIPFTESKEGVFELLRR